MSALALRAPWITAPQGRVRTVGIAAGVAAAAIAAPWMLGASGLLVATLGLAYAVAALSLVVLTGWAGQVSLGQVSFMGVGAFVTARLMDPSIGVPLWAAVPIAIFAAALASLLIGIPAVRLRGVHLAVVTIAFAQVMQSAVFSNRALTGSGNGLQLARPAFGPLDFASDRTTYFVLLGTLVVTCASVALLRRSEAGRRIMALRSHPAVVGARGIDVARTMLTAVVVSAALAGFAGCLLALALQSTGPASFNPLQSVMLLALVVVCGPRSIASAVAAGMLFGALPSLLARLLGDTLGGPLTNLLAGGVLLASLLVRERLRDVAA